jgi:hypothetical protein
MTLPKDMTVADLVKIIDSTDNALAFLKDVLVRDPKAPNIPVSDHFMVKTIKSSELLVCYGPKHPLYQPGSTTQATFTIWLKVTEFGTTFGPGGARPPDSPVSVSIMRCDPI